MLLKTFIVAGSVLFAASALAQTQQNQGAPNQVQQQSQTPGSKQPNAQGETPAPGRTIDPTDLHEHAGRQLARFKVPRYIEIVTELPHTATDRLAKHQLSKERTPAEIDFEAPTRNEVR